MKVQLSVAYKGGYYSYEISSDNGECFLFNLKSAPAKSTFKAPDNFEVTKKGNKWEVPLEFDKEFRKGLMTTLKKILKK